jgi:hypothetical protein
MTTKLQQKRAEQAYIYGYGSLLSSCRKRQKGAEQAYEYGKLAEKTALLPSFPLTSWPPPLPLLPPRPGRRPLPFLLSPSVSGCSVLRTRPRPPAGTPSAPLRPPSASGLSCTPSPGDLALAPAPRPPAVAARDRSVGRPGGWRRSRPGSSTLPAHSADRAPAGPLARPSSLSRRYGAAYARPTSTGCSATMVMTSNTTAAPPERRRRTRLPGPARIGSHAEPGGAARPGPHCLQRGTDAQRAHGLGSGAVPRARAPAAGSGPRSASSSCGSAGGAQGSLPPLPPPPAHPSQPCAPRFG